MSGPGEKIVADAVEAIKHKAPSKAAIVKMLVDVREAELHGVHEKRPTKPSRKCVIRLHVQVARIVPISAKKGQRQQMSPLVGETSWPQQAGHNNPWNPLKNCIYSGDTPIG